MTFIEIPFFYNLLFLFRLKTHTRSKYMHKLPGHHFFKKKLFFMHSFNIIFQLVSFSWFVSKFTNYLFDNSYLFIPPIKFSLYTYIFISKHFSHASSKSISLKILGKNLCTWMNSCLLKSIHMLILIILIFLMILFDRFDLGIHNSTYNNAGFLNPKIILYLLLCIALKCCYVY